jgi:hypothetical protein
MPTDTNPDETPTVETPAESGAAADPKPEPPAAPRSRRGLVIAGAIVGAVVVLGATFGGGVLVGSATADHGHRPMMQHGQPAAGSGPRGDSPWPGSQRDRNGQRNLGNGLPGQ